ncbi:MAG: response regulator [Planctomycetota bacterium]
MKGRADDVVLLEDSDIDFDIFKMILKTLGLELNVHRFNRIEKMTDAIQGSELPSEISLVICDLRLPDGNGIEVVKHLRSLTQYVNTPIVILSTSANPKDVSECYTAGANAFHCKLTDLDALTTQTGKLLDYWLKMVVADRKHLRF